MVPQPEWLGPVLAVTLMATGFLLLLLSLGILLYAFFQDAKDQVARNRAKAAQSAAGQSEAGQ